MSPASDLRRPPAAGTWRCGRCSNLQRTNQSRVLGHLVRGRLRLRGVVVEDPRRRVRRVRVLVLGGRVLLRREVVLQTGLVKLCHFLQHKAPCRSLYDCFRCILIIRWPRLIFN